MAKRPEDVVIDESEVAAVEHNVDSMLNDPKWVRANIEINGPGEHALRIILSNITLTPHEVAAVSKKYKDAGWVHVEVSSGIGTVEVCLWNYLPAQKDSSSKPDHGIL